MQFFSKILHQNNFRKLMLLINENLQSPNKWHIRNATIDDTFQYHAGTE